MLRFYTMGKEDAKPSRMRFAAWFVHTYTASGAVLAFVAAWAVLHGDDRLAFAALFVATIVDGTDGALARAARVRDVLPDVDGGRIDDIVDFLTYVFVPMLLLEAGGGLPRRAALPVVAVVLMSSVYGFVAPDAKTADHFFTGFPSYWNIVVLYLLLFAVPPGVNAAVLLFLSGMIFVRTPWIYPTRTPVWRTLTLVLAGAWAALLGAIIAMWPSPPKALAIASLVFPVYYIVLSLVLHVRRPRVSGA